MADAYASSRKPKQPRTEPPPTIVGPKTGIRSVDDIADMNLRAKAQRVQQVLPHVAASRIHLALVKNKGVESNALSWLTDEAEKQSRSVDLTTLDDEKDQRSPISKPPAKQSVQNSKSITQKYSSTQQQPRATIMANFAESLLARGTTQPNSKPVAPIQGVKRAVVSSKPIAEKWSSTTAKPSPSEPPAPSQPDEDEASPPKKRRRLIAGRGAEFVSASPRESPAVEQRKPAAPLKRAAASDDDSDADSAMGLDEQVSDEVLDKKILDYVNTCTAPDLVDITSQKDEVVDFVLAHRPFHTLNGLKALVSESKSVTKTGKTRTSKNAVGEKMYDTLYEMFQGYEAVDQLVKTCEELGKPIAAEMRHWGFDAFGAAAQDGELQLVDLAPAHDSGIGTPASSLGSDSVSGDELPKVKKHAKLLQQPSNMSESLVMKDYQVAGLNWLALLFSKKLSCILADDMGLGKTCQVIAFLAHLHSAGLSKGPHLVIVPGSTLENWLREFQAFCPSLRVEPYYGGQRERPEMRERILGELKAIDVIVTTYDMASKGEDTHFLRKLAPVVCVYDEGHALKNSQSQRYKQLMRIPAQFRLLLTGTPLQNNLQELIALLSFIMPHVFKEKEATLSAIFRHRAKTTDTEHTALLSSERITRARSMMTPFILRRKKHQVLKHLPQKTKRVVYCDLLPEQRKLYDERSQEARDAFLSAEAEASAKSKAPQKGRGAYSSTKLSQNVLMDLRKSALSNLLFRRHYTDRELRRLAATIVKAQPQRNEEYVFEDLTVCSDMEVHQTIGTPEYVDIQGIERFALQGEPWMESGKVAKTVELIKKWAANGERTLIFSQFVKVLDILELVFESAGIAFYRLDGSTPMHTRQDLLDGFYVDQTPVFMLSTKAGGAGINLACANKVIIFDMSFNPQDDVQAENRAHRVGQTREVEVVRLVSRNTIEEQILRLGQSKLALDREVAGEGEKEGAADAKGADLVRDMFLGRVAEGRHDTDPEKQEEATNGDLKDEFMKGLKGRGLDMSAAT